MKKRTGTTGFFCAVEWKTEIISRPLCQGPSAEWKVKDKNLYVQDCLAGICI